MALDKALTESSSCQTSSSQRARASREAESELSNKSQTRQTRDFSSWHSAKLSFFNATPKPYAHQRCD
eukprot:875779-Amphidinium_carterae.1